MRVHTISLNSFRCFRDFSLELDPDLTVIVGKNASGKSTLLRGLTVGLAACLSGMSVENLKAPGIDLTDVRYETVQAGNTFERQKQFPVILSMKADFPEKKSVSWQRVRKTMKGRITRAESQPALLVKDTRNGCAKAMTRSFFLSSATTVLNGSGCRKKTAVHFRLLKDSAAMSTVWMENPMKN